MRIVVTARGPMELIAKTAVVEMYLVNEMIVAKYQDGRSFFLKTGQYQFIS